MLGNIQIIASGGIENATHTPLVPGATMQPLLALKFHAC
jgi:hypothetical protein